MSTTLISLRPRPFRLLVHPFSPDTILTTLSHFLLVRLSTASPCTTTGRTTANIDTTLRLHSYFFYLLFVFSLRHKSSYQQIITICMYGVGSVIRAGNKLDIRLIF
jgi:hypothetical protein